MERLGFRPDHSAGISPRQNAVLDQALRLLVEGGEKALTTSGLARAANCSKESLYKWFGDRDGLLAAMITFQQSKVRTFERRVTASPHHSLPITSRFSPMTCWMCWQATCRGA